MVYRIGRVALQDAEGCRVRVAFEADDELASYWLPVMQSRAGGDRVYWMPDLDDQVVCLLDAHAEDGVVLGAIYSEVDTPPVASLNRLHVRMRDGSVIDYDRAAHRLTVALAGEGAEIAISTPGAVTITAGGGVTVNVPEGQHVHVGGSGGEELVRRSHLEDYYRHHMHLSAAPGSPTSGPIVLAPCTPGIDLTSKQLSE